MADPDTKNATRLLVARLALALNVDLPRRRENAGVDLGGGFQGAVERIAKMRGRRATA